MPLFAESEDVHAGAKPLGFDLLGIKEPGECVDCVGSDFRCLSQEVGASPQTCGVSLRGRCMVGIGDVGMFLRPQPVGSDDVAAGEYVEVGADDAHISDFRPDVGGGGRVFDRSDLDVPVPRDLRLLPGHFLPGEVGQIDEVGRFVFGEPVSSAAIVAAERCPVVDPVNTFDDGFVDVIAVDECSVIKVVDDPVRDDFDAGFDVGFLFGFVGPGRHGSSGVVLEECGVGLVDVASLVVAADLVRSRRGVIGDDDLSDAAEVFEGASMGVAPCW